ncbi:MAG: WecB/TagA/CpsF family glycosyltransferase [Bacilli bacterium]|nr:WecB/TagA/CpsF family glycosyltransferase [Bacilli bacterium]
MEKESIFGVKVCVTSYEEILNFIDKDIINKKKSFVVAINPEKIMKTRKNEFLKKILNSASYQLPDGIGIVYASKFRNGRIRKRITGIDLMEKICFLASNNNYSVFLYGSHEEVLDKTESVLIKKYESINIVGKISGYGKTDSEIVEIINKKQPNILFVALGSPKQEYFIYNNMLKIKCNIFMGVGGSFDVISGNVKRAPVWMQNKGLEWFYRLVKNPKRIVRQIKLIPFFVLTIFKK